MMSQNKAEIKINSENYHNMFREIQDTLDVEDDVLLSSNFCLQNIETTPSSRSSPH
jgi:hypothetical protein